MSPCRPVHRTLQSRICPTRRWAIRPIPMRRCCLLRVPPSPAASRGGGRRCSLTLAAAMRRQLSLGSSGGWPTERQLRHTQVLPRLLVSVRFVGLEVLSQEHLPKETNKMRLDLDSPFARSAEVAVRDSYIYTRVNKPNQTKPTIIIICFDIHRWSILREV